jgi:hypothetical protein
MHSGEVGHLAHGRIVGQDAGRVNPKRQPVKPRSRTQRSLHASALFRQAPSETPRRLRRHSLPAAAARLTMSATRDTPMAR